MIALITLHRDVAILAQKGAMNHTMLQQCLLHLPRAIVVLSFLANFQVTWKDFVLKSNALLIASMNYTEAVCIMNVILVGVMAQTMAVVLIVQTIITKATVSAKHQVLDLYVTVVDMVTKFLCVLFFLLVLSLLSKIGIIALIALIILNLDAVMLVL